MTYQTVPVTSSSFDLFRSMSRKILEENDVSGVLRIICEEGCRVLGADGAMVICVTASGNGNEINREILYAHNEPDELVRSLEMNHRPSLVSAVLEKGEMEVIPDILADPRMAEPEITRKVGYRAVCVIPLNVEGNSFGGLILHHYSCRVYSPNDHRLARVLGDLASLAIEKSRIIRALEEKTDRLEIVGNIAKAINSIMEPREIFQTIVQEIRKSVPCQRCVISTIDSEANKYIYWHYESEIDVPLRSETIGENEWKGEGVYDTKKPLRIPDLNGNGLWKFRRMAQNGFRSSLLVPIVQSSRCIAHLNIASVRLNSFSQDDEDLLVSIADYLGSAIWNAQLFRESKEKEKRLSKLIEVNQRLTRGLDLQSLLNSLVQASVELLQGDHSRLFLFDEGRETLTLKAWYGKEPDFQQTGWTLMERATIVEEVFRTGKEIIVQDVGTSPKTGPPEGFQNREASSFIAQPLFNGDRVIGVINCLSEKKAFFSHDDLDLLGSFASQAAIAIEENRLYNEARENALRQEITAEIAKAVGSTLEPDKLFKTIVREIQKIIPCERCFVSAQDHRFEFNWDSKPDADMDELGRTDVESIFQWVREICEGKEIVNIRNLGESDSPRARKLAGAGFQSALAVPILQGERSIAHLSLMSVHRDAFLAEHEMFLSSINHHLGSVIQNASLYDAAQKRAVRFAVLNELNKKITENLDLREVFSSFAQATVQLVNADHVRIFLFDEFSSRLAFRVGSGGVPAPENKEGSPGPREDITGYVFERGEPVISPNVAADSRFSDLEWLREMGFHAYIGQPIGQGGRTIGVISCFSRPEGFFNDEDLEFLGALASQAAIAIQNAEVHLELRKSLEELNRSQEMIIRAEKLSSLGVLAAGAAHEILNPSSVIQIRAELLKDKAAPGSRERKNSEIILKNVERIRKICDNLRRFSREENARHRVFSLEYLIRETVELFDHEFRQRNIEIALDVDYNMSMIKGESHQIQQVLVILLANSRDAMPEGGRITIQSKDVTVDGKRWREVRISDTGEGIPEPIRSKIFDPFFTTKSEDEGTGLGLSVLHGILENHGGTVDVESEEGKGTTFSIRIPVGDGCSPPED